MVIGFRNDMKVSGEPGYFVWDAKEPHYSYEGIMVARIRGACHYSKRAYDHPSNFNIPNRSSSVGSLKRSQESSPIQPHSPMPTVLTVSSLHSNSLPSPDTASSGCKHERICGRFLGEI
jgi:hypothetical protein